MLIVGKLGKYRRAKNIKMKDSLGSTFNYNKSLHTSVFLSAAFQGLNVYLDVYIIMGFLGGSDGKESACTAGHPGSILGLRRSAAEGNGNPLQDSCLENPIDRGAWWVIVRKVTRVEQES